MLPPRVPFSESRFLSHGGRAWTLSGYGHVKGFTYNPHPPSPNHPAPPPPPPHPPHTPIPVATSLTGRYWVWFLVPTLTHIWFLKATTLRYRLWGSRYGWWTLSQNRDERKDDILIQLIFTVTWCVIYLGVQIKGECRVGCLRYVGYK